MISPKKQVQLYAFVDLIIRCKLDDGKEDL